MNKKEFEELLCDATNDSDLELSDIPSIDLYLDQILSLVSEAQSRGSERFSDRVLTKTMINNYSKDGLIMPVKGKKYSKEHILQMLTVYQLKNTLSIGEIKRVLRGVYLDESFDSDAMSDCYKRFLEIRRHERENTGEIVNSFLSSENLDINNDRDFFVALMGLVSLSGYIKNVTQALLEAKYPDPEKTEDNENGNDGEGDVKEKEKESKKSAKAAEKAEKKEKKEKEKEKKKEIKDEKKSVTEGKKITSEA